MKRQSTHELLWEVKNHTQGDLIAITDPKHDRVTEGNYVPLTRSDLIEMLAKVDGSTSTSNTPSVIIGGGKSQ